MPHSTPDAHLQGLLESLNLDFESVKSTIRGVAAAPDAFDERGWLELVRPEANEDLDRALLAFKEAVSSKSTHGLGQNKPPKTRLAALRAELDRQGVNGFIIPRADEHQGEYVPACASRLAWLTGFTGSAGAAAVLRESAAIFVDGRYTLQVEVETDTAVFAPQHLVEQPLADWLAKGVRPGDVIAYDPWLHTLKNVRMLTQALQRAGATLRALSANPLDAVWGDQPPRPISPVRVQPMAFSGQSSLEKRSQVAALLAAESADAVFFSLPDSIAWLLNIRGADIPRTPFVLCFVLLTRSGEVTLFVDERKLTRAARGHLDDVRICSPGELGSALEVLGSAGRRVWIDPASAPQWAVDHLAGAELVERLDPCALPKAKKNAVELAGSREAHLRDGAAVTRFLSWLEQTLATGTTTELAAVAALEASRREAPELVNLSFDTISGAGPNGAVVHYRVSEATDRALETCSLYLVDSGGQYMDGTTDITRTVAVGEPTDEMRDRFTRVLKGHIALARVRFPQGTTGSQLDILARYPLWQAGLDYDHGTGHGVGAYLSVHEGPQRISKSPSSTGLEAGMILSNEPGYYKSDAFGIRIENLVAVRDAGPIPGGERAMLEFETLTMAPIDRHLVALELLDAHELAWLNSYHATVRANLKGRLEGEALAFLLRSTEAL